MKYISLHDKEEAEESLRKIYQLIAAYGRKVRERKWHRELIADGEPKVTLTSIPHGNYFTVYQAARICGATSKQIRAWVRKGKLAAFDLPGLGLIIEADNLNKFLYQNQRHS